MSTGSSDSALTVASSAATARMKLDYTDTGHKFATLAGNGDTLWTSPTGTDVQVRNEAMQPIGSPLHHDRDVSALGFSPDGHRIATGSTDHKVRIWDADTGRPIGAPLQHDGTILAIIFSRDGQTMAVADFNQSVRLWDVNSGKPIGEPMHQDGLISGVAFSSDGRLLVQPGVQCDLPPHRLPSDRSAI